MSKEVKIETNLTDDKIDDFLQQLADTMFKMLGVLEDKTIPNVKSDKKS